MPTEFAILLLGGLVVAMGATGMELMGSFTPPACPECPHCRQLAHEARVREEQEVASLQERIRDSEPRQDRERRDRR